MPRKIREESPTGVYHWIVRGLAVDRDEYLLECGRYIERNPVKAKLVKDPEAYSYSSYPYYAKGSADDLATPSPAYLGLSSNESERRAIYADYVREDRIQEEMMERGLLPA